MGGLRAHSLCILEMLVMKLFRPCFELYRGTFYPSYDWHWFARLVDSLVSQCHPLLWDERGQLPNSSVLSYHRQAYKSHCLGCLVERGSKGRPYGE